MCFLEGIFETLNTSLFKGKKKNQLFKKVSYKVPAFKFIFTYLFLWSQPGSHVYVLLPFWGILFQSNRQGERESEREIIAPKLPHAIIQPCGDRARILVNTWQVNVGTLPDELSDPVFLFGRNY